MTKFLHCFILIFTIFSCSDTKISDSGTINLVDNTKPQQQESIDLEGHQDSSAASEPVMIGGAYLVNCEVTGINPTKYDCQFSSGVENLSNIIQISAIFIQPDGSLRKVLAELLPTVNTWKFIVTIPIDLIYVGSFSLEVSTSQSLIIIPSANILIGESAAGAAPNDQVVSASIPEPVATPVADPVAAPVADPVAAPPVAEPVATPNPLYNISFVGTTDCLTAPTLPSAQTFSNAFALKRQPCTTASKLTQVTNPNGTFTFMRGTDQCLQAMRSATTIYYVISLCTRQPASAREFTIRNINHSGRIGLSLDLPSFNSPSNACLAHMSSPNSGFAFMYLCSQNIPIELK